MSRFTVDDLFARAWRVEGVLHDCPPGYAAYHVVADAPELGHNAGGLVLALDFPQGDEAEGLYASALARRLVAEHNEAPLLRAELKELKRVVGLRQKALGDARKERDEAAALREEVERLQSLVDAYKAASGLVDSSGDPDGIEPRHVEREISLLRADSEARAAAERRAEEAEGRFREVWRLLLRWQIDHELGRGAHAMFLPEYRRMSAEGAANAASSVARKLGMESVVRAILDKDEEALARALLPPCDEEA